MKELKDTHYYHLYSFISISVRYWYTIQSQPYGILQDTLSQDGLSFDIQDVIPIKFQMKLTRVI